jgi:hypothetical protein
MEQKFLILKLSKAILHILLINADRFLLKVIFSKPILNIPSKMEQLSKIWKN